MSPINQAQAGEVIRAARIATGRSQAELAADINVSQCRISEWEAGKRAITLRDATAIADALDLSAIYDGRRLSLVDPATVRLPKEG